MNPLSPSVSVIFCATAKQTWESFCATLSAIQRQTVAAGELIVVVDHNPSLLDRAVAHFPHLKIVSNTDVRGMSGTRHTGLQLARGRVIAFLEGNEMPHTNWLTDLVSVYNSGYSTGAERPAVADLVPQRKVS